MLYPALIARLELSGARLADLTDAQILAEFDATANIHQCEWREMLDQGLVPKTHRLRDRLLAGGLHGVIYPSFMSPGVTCVALWRWNEDDAPRLDVVDPDHRLPRTPASWL